jgi:pimeloyl-ACP methyl ester carboxylesterase
MIKKILLYTLAVLVLMILTASFALYLKSPGKPLPLVNTSGNTLAEGISVIEKIRIGGIDQYLIIRGNDINNPVLLFLHGGPGSPEIAFMNHHNRALEEDFTMVYWEQRGSGKSFSSRIAIESMTTEQFIADAREVSQYLSQRFSQPKIYLMGHSWGSMLGIQVAWQHPELYHAYLGVGQVADQYRGEQISFEWVKQQARERNDHKAIKTLGNMVFPDTLATVDDWLSFVMVERNYVNKYGGAMRDYTSMWPLIKMALLTPEYTFTDKINYMRGSLFSLRHLWMEVVANNLFTRIDSVQVPVYIFQGINDYQTPYVVAKEFFDHVKAPRKAFYPFENSAHSPLMEEPEKFNALLKQILQQNQQDPV